MILFPTRRLFMVKRPAARKAPDGSLPIVDDLFVADGTDGAVYEGMFLTDKSNGFRVLKIVQVPKEDAREPKLDEVRHYTHTILAYPTGPMRLRERDFRQGIKR